MRQQPPDITKENHPPLIYLKEYEKNSKSVIDYLFKRFLYIWGRKWAEKLDGMEEGVKQEWTESIKWLTQKQIDTGITEARNQFKWPPEIAEFLPLCKGECAVQPNHFNCSVGGCPNTGTMCRNTHGNNWICNIHWNQGKG